MQWLPWPESNHKLLLLDKTLLLLFFSHVSLPTVLVGQMIIWAWLLSGAQTERCKHEILVTAINFFLLSLRVNLWIHRENWKLLANIKVCSIHGRQKPQLFTTEASRRKISLSYWPGQPNPISHLRKAGIYHRGEKTHFLPINRENCQVRLLTIFFYSFPTFPFFMRYKKKREKKRTNQKR